MDDLKKLRELAEKATPGPWERGDRWHIQSADMCQCAPQRGPLVAEVERDINGTTMLAHIHRREEPWFSLGILSRHLYEGRYVQQVIVETDEYGTMSDADAEFIAAVNPVTVQALLDRLEQVEGELYDSNKELGICKLRSTSRFEAYQEKKRELRQMEIRAERAEAAIERVRATHYKYTYYEDEDSCPNTSEEHREEHHHESEEIGEFYCDELPTGDVVCGSCRDEDGERMDYPCPTIAALDGEEK